jgi:hypothetical protein
VSWGQNQIVFEKKEGELKVLNKPEKVELSKDP